MDWRRFWPPIILSVLACGLWVSCIWNGQVASYWMRVGLLCDLLVAAFLIYKEEKLLAQADESFGVEPMITNYWNSGVFQAFLLNELGLQMTGSLRAGILASAFYLAIRVSVSGPRVMECIKRRKHARTALLMTTLRYVACIIVPYILLHSCWQAVSHARGVSGIPVISLVCTLLDLSTLTLAGVMSHNYARLDAASEPRSAPSLAVFVILGISGMLSAFSDVGISADIASRMSAAAFAMKTGILCGIVNGAWIVEWNVASRIAKLFQQIHG